jgi:hypothetical protein
LTYRCNLGDGCAPTYPPTLTHPTYASDHRIGENPAEFARLERAGGCLARLNEYGAGPSRSAAEGVGPVRLWPGGIMVGRAIGDRDVGPILLPRPHIRQVRLPPSGARLVLASDGLWDGMPMGRVARVLRSHATPKGAATQAISTVAASRGGFLSDDVTGERGRGLAGGSLDVIVIE